MSDPFTSLSTGGWLPFEPPWQPTPAPPRPPGPGALVISLAAVITLLLLSAGVAVAVKNTPATGHAAAGHHPGVVPIGPSTTVPSAAVPPATTTAPPTTRPGSVAPVSPLSVPPVNSPPVSTRRSALPASLIAAMVNPTVVDVDARLAYEHASAAGTGMVLTSNGLILTNNHVISGGTTIQGVAIGNGRAYSAHVVGVDPSADIAVIQLEGASGLTPISTSVATVSRGDPVVAIGNAGGVGGPPSVTTGAVQATDQSIVASDPAAGTSEQLDGLIETDANLQPGDSGGPLINGTGQVIGMDTAASVSSGSANVSFAIPIGPALAVARQIEAGQTGNGVFLGLPPFLGVQVEAGSLGSRTGPVVAAIVAGGPASGAGVTIGSLITAVNGQAIDSPSTLSRVLRQYRPGDPVTFSWLDRSGVPHSARVTLATGPAD